MGNAHPSIAPYETLATADGPLAVAVGNDKQFRALTRVLSVPELGTDPRFADNSCRVAHRDELKALLEDRLRTGSAADWADRLTAAGVPAGKVNSVVEALGLAEALGLEPVVQITDPDGSRTSQQVSNPIRLSGTPARYRRVPPLLGEHSGASFGHPPTAG